MADPRRISKVFASNVPSSFLAGEQASQMTPASPFGPGEPIGPYDGYNRTPRSHNFVTGYNIATRPRTHERVSFDILRGLVESYDVAQMCIWHRIDSIRSLDWSLVAKPGYGGDVADAISIGMQVLAMPDHTQPFSSWLASWLYDILAYDAGTLYRKRNRRGDVVGLMNVDGTTIAPLLDYWGNTPTAEVPGGPEPEAYVQYVNGLPWNWLTVSDLIYQPFRKRANSPYGLAPLETILLNANTDLRFQSYFLQRFTDGNIPEAFAAAPDEWTPDQIEAFQEYWDTAMYGDQAAKHQIKWMPGGSAIAWSNERDFQDAFSLFLMRKTAAAFHVVPADLGFTESVNRSSGESQADVQHRVGDLPLIRHVTGILTRFLQNDLGLPLEFLFDLGEEQTDRLDQAQADKIYMELGVISGSELRADRYGLNEPAGQTMPRFVLSSRSGPIPLSSLYAVAGQIDQETAAPLPGAPMPHTVFGGVEGVLPNPPIKVMSLAEQEYGESAMPPAPPPQPVMQAPEPAPGETVAKDGAPTAGITASTGIASYDLVGHDEDEDENDHEDREQLVKAELAAFRSFRKSRSRKGRWRDFEFRFIDAATAADLNSLARLAVEKADAGKGDAPSTGASDEWPGWGTDEDTARHWAHVLAAALGAALTVQAAEQLAGQFATLYDGVDPSTLDEGDLAETATEWLAGQQLDLETPVADTLTGLWTDGYLVGTTSAEAAASGGQVRRGGWQPGDTATASSVISQHGAADGLLPILAGAAAAAAGIAATRRQDMGRALAKGLIAGLVVRKLGQAIVDALASLNRALNITITEITRSSGLAALYGYQQMGVTQVRWALDPGSKTCPVCIGNAAAGPVRLGAAFPSGDTHGPVHPNCRCNVVPA